MASRPIYLPSRDGPEFVRTEVVQFAWVPGLALSQKQKSISAMHEAARTDLGVADVLEISTKSMEETGRALSAFNLMLHSPGGRMSVECAFQGSKVFEQGGPYTDIYAMSSREAKTDPRLKESGRLVAFEFEQERWPIEPQTAFYDWLYIQALGANTALSERVVDVSAFSDIEFNPEKSINCQAYSAALFASFTQRGMLPEAIASKASFLEVAGRGRSTGPREAGARQGSLF